MGFEAELMASEQFMALEKKCHNSFILNAATVMITANQILGEPLVVSGPDEMGNKRTFRIIVEEVEGKEE